MELPSNISKEDLPQKVQDIIGDNDFEFEPFIDGDLDAMGLGPRALADYSTHAHGLIRQNLSESMDRVLNMNRRLKKSRKRVTKSKNIVSIIDGLNKNTNLENQ